MPQKTPKKIASLAIDPHALSLLDEAAWHLSMRRSEFLRAALWCGYVRIMEGDDPHYWAALAEHAETPTAIDVRRTTT